MGRYTTQDVRDGDIIEKDEDLRNLVCSTALALTLAAVVVLKERDAGGDAAATGQ